ncbi:DUF11 domain-containing protein [Actinomadura oligospora]|uniref:DUF11 domain-containing protein n=1 Tax=Actinomadura oligospora TaxID=111804 RepID=UPI00047D556A|nr:DUF11 domain-containing protein [Actinomadura oligospora]
MALRTPARSATGKGGRGADPRAGKVEVSYSSPKLVQAGGVLTWSWTVRNTGGEAVKDVVLVHRLTPQLKVGKLPQECKAVAAEIRCSYGVLQAGATSRGDLTATVPSAARGSVKVNGRVTWQPGPVPAGGLAASGSNGMAGATGTTGVNGASGVNGAAAPKGQVAPRGQAAPKGQTAPRGQAVPGAVRGARH